MSNSETTWPAFAIVYWPPTARDVLINHWMEGVVVDEAQEVAHFYIHRDAARAWCGLAMWCMCLFNDGTLYQLKPVNIHDWPDDEEY